MTWKQALKVALSLTLMLGLLPLLAVAEPQAPDKIEQALLDQITTTDSTSYLVYFRDQANLSPAYQMEWHDRGRFIVRALQAAAELSQARVRDYLDTQTVAYEAFWIDNVIAVKGSDSAVLYRIAGWPEVEIVRAQRTMHLIEPVEQGEADTEPLAIEPNISHVQAPDVWTTGFSGEGMIVSNIDTGVRYTHKALVGQYRGNAGFGSFTHDYNWLDPDTGIATPWDDHGHGSHTMGTMLGDDGGANQIGIAPEAQWIACKGCNNTDGCPDTALLTCAQWVAAPYPIGQPGSPNPDMRPHVVNNSWGDCGRSYDGWYQNVVNAWHAAGIYPVFSNGNAGNCNYSYPPGCNTVGNPARYGNVTGVGSTGQSNGQYATHSNWGPTDNPDTVNPRGYATLKPQVLAPGVNIRSSLNGSDSQYASWGGTSMSSPHVSGLIVLMWQAAPCLLGDYANTETILEQSAVPIPYASQCGGEGPGDIPNQATGWGEINALAAVQAAQTFCGSDRGYLDGYVYDAASLDPIAGASVTASPAARDESSILSITDPTGYYTMTLLPHAYDVTASNTGYSPETIAGVEIQVDSVTHQDFHLDYVGQWLPGPSVPPFQYNRFDGVFNPHDDLIYFLGGRTGGGSHDASIWTYDTANDTWADTHCDMNHGASNITIALVEDDGTGRGEALYVVGGYDIAAGANINTVQRFYPSQPGCIVEDVAADPYPDTVAGHIVGAGGVAVANNKIYVFGGWEGDTAPYFSDKTWEFNPQATSGNRWIQVTSATLNPARSYINVAVQGGLIYAMGGISYYASGPELDPTNAAEVFDPANPGAGWVALSNMPLATAEGRGFGFQADTRRLDQPGGKIYVVGGGDWPGESAEVLEYDVAADTWNQMFPNLMAARRDHAGVYVPLCTPDPADGLPGMWVFGGNVGADDPPYGNPEYFPLPCDQPLPPKANFTWTPFTVYTSTVAHFLDQSSGPVVEWLWEFSDGYEYSSQNPIHTFLTTGTFSVTLTVTSETSLAHITLKEVIVHELGYEPSRIYLPIVVKGR